MQQWRRRIAVQDSELAVLGLKIAFPKLVAFEVEALEYAVPVITQTPSPSVTGEGDDMLPLRVASTLRLSTGRFQRSSPVARSRHHRSNASSLATFRKSRSCQMIGVEPLSAGRGTFQVMFSSALQDSGAPDASPTPFRFGPRQWGQFSA